MKREVNEITKIVLLSDTGKEADTLFRMMMAIVQERPKNVLYSAKRKYIQANTFHICIMPNDQHKYCGLRADLTYPYTKDLMGKSKHTEQECTMEHIIEFIRKELWHSSTNSRIKQSL